MFQTVTTVQRRCLTTCFEALHRLVEIAILAREHEDAVMETADAVGPEGMYRDLNRLRMEIEAASSFFREQADHVRAMCSKKL